MRTLLTAYTLLNRTYDDFLTHLPFGLENLHKLNELDTTHVDLIVPLPVDDISNTPSNMYLFKELIVVFGGTSHTVKIYRTRTSNSHKYFISHSAFFTEKLGKDFVRKTFPETFSLDSTITDANYQTYLYIFFSLCVVEFISSGFNTYDVVHILGSELGLLPTLLVESLNTAAPSLIFTIFDITKQVTISKSLAMCIKELPINSSIISFDTTDNVMNFTLEGVAKADFISTSSRNYAKNFLFKDLSGDLALIVEARSDRIIGINEGFDYEHIIRGYDTDNCFHKKLKFKNKLLANLNLNVTKNLNPCEIIDSINYPIFLYSAYGNVSKNSFTYKVLQNLPNTKGIHLIISDSNNYERNCEMFNAPNCQCIILSGGDSAYHKNSTQLNLLALMRSVDYYVMLDRVPLNINIIALANYFGVLSISFSSGVAKDLIKDSVNGFLFGVYDTKSVFKALSRANDSFVFGESHLEMMVISMNMRFSWEDTARKYMEIYDKSYQIKNHDFELLSEE